MLENNQYAFIFYGISGSGKGTQAKLLIELLKKKNPKSDVIYIETGARIREFITDNAGYTRDIVKEIIDKGGLLPEFIPISLWSHLFITRFTGKEHLVLDGVSRRAHESPIIETALKFYGFKKPIIILINTTREWAKKRLRERKRADDDDAEIERRFSWFEENTMPAVNHFRNKPDTLFIEVNGERSIEEVHNDIVEKSGLA